MTACETAPNDVKSKILVEEDAQNSKKLKRKAENVSGVLEFFATFALAVRAHQSEFWSVSIQHEVQALGPLAVKMTAAFSGQGAVGRYQKSIGLHPDRYLNDKQPMTF